MTQNSSGVNTLSHPATRETGRYVLVAILLCISSASQFLAPVVISTFLGGYGLSVAGAGTLTTVELVFSGATGLCLAGFLRTANVARWTIIAAALTMLCQALSTLSLPFEAFVLVRVLAGLSYGVCWAVACYLSSQSPSGVRIMGVAFMASSAIYGGLMFFLPSAVVEFGVRGLYWPLVVIALVTVVVAVKVGNLPRHEVSIDKPVVPAAAAGRRDLCLLLVVSAFSNGGILMLWTFSEGVAKARDFDINVTAVILGVSMLFNIVGAIFAAVLDRRMGVSRPLALGLVGVALSGCIVGVWVTVAGFGVGFLLYGFASFFILPYIVGAGASLDETGRAATLGGATMYMAGALSPLIGGVIAEQVSLTAVCWVAMVSCLIAAFSTWKLRGALDKDVDVLEDVDVFEASSGSAVQ